MAGWGQGLWIITLNYKDDSLKEDLRVIKRQILGFPSLQNIFLGKLLSEGVREEQLQL